uniref:M15 family metallopeptidase n=1 Tax=Fulvivirga sp. TaxID=1931237 RepID=UPI0040495944
DGTEVEMGTAFDFFGKEANHDFTDLPENILKNRKLLKEVMESFSFKSIRTEWWHYNFINARQYALSNFQTDCN